jgi:hypothetical protein
MIIFVTFDLLIYCETWLFRISNLNVLLSIFLINLHESTFSILKNRLCLWSIKSCELTFHVFYLILEMWLDTLALKLCDLLAIANDFLFLDDFIHSHEFDFFWCDRVKYSWELDIDSEMITMIREEWCDIDRDVLVVIDCEFCIW